MCQGELDQLYWTKSGGTSKETYLEVIGGKTASLMSACCELGAVSLGENVDKEQPYRALLHDFGYEYGLVFQMRDDMADEGNMHDIHLLTDDVGTVAGFRCQNSVEGHAGVENRAMRDEGVRNAII